MYILIWTLAYRAFIQIQFDCKYNFLEWSASLCVHIHLNANMLSLPYIFTYFCHTHSALQLPHGWQALPGIPSWFWSPIAVLWWAAPLWWHQCRPCIRKSRLVCCVLSTVNKPSDWFFLQRFIQDPYATTFGGFSKVTNFFRGALRNPESPLNNRSPQDPHFPHSADEEPGFELITCVSLRPYCLSVCLSVYKCCAKYIRIVHSTRVRSLAPDLRWNEESLWIPGSSFWIQRVVSQIHRKSRSWYLEGCVHVSAIFYNPAYMPQLVLLKGVMT